MTDLKDIITIRDSHIDTEAILDTIQRRLTERRTKATALGLDYDRIAKNKSRLRESKEQNLATELYDALQKARHRANNIWIPLSIVGQRTPLLQPLTSRVRQAAHSLVLYYVNMLAGRQTAFNESAVETLAQMTSTLEESQNRIQLLEDEIVELKEQLSILTQPQPNTKL